MTDFFMFANVDTERITPWLLGVNFTLAIFSINFTFFGHQLSRYKPLYSMLTKRQWLNTFLLISLPFLPLLVFLILPIYFELCVFLVMPALVILAIDNAVLTRRYLSPEYFLKSLSGDSLIAKYLGSISLELQNEYAENQPRMRTSKYQLPMHSGDFESTVYGLSQSDIWDSLTVISKLAVLNNDYAIFRETISVALKLQIAFHSFRHTGKNSYTLDNAIQKVARARFKPFILRLLNDDENGVFLQSISNELCDFLVKPEVLKKPCSSMTRAIVADLVWIGCKTLEKSYIVEPLKILNTVHIIVEENMYRLDNESSDLGENSLDKNNILIYAHDIKILGLSALKSGNSHFGYRCIETLSYLGCNAVKVKSSQVVIAVLQSITQLGRTAKNLGVECFWNRCLISFDSHVEEFFGHIFTWLAKDLDEEGDFYLKGYAEQSISRLRGVKCLVKPKNHQSYPLWIEEITEDGKSIPHVEREIGMYGHKGEMDYSDYSQLKEYVLHGSSSDLGIVHSSPMPFEIEFEDD